MREDEANGKRFSLAAYSMKFQARRDILSGDAKEANQPDATPFQRLVEEIRGYLVSGVQGSEEERRQYNETLNRAVLGFTEARTKMLAIINDQLMKRRIHDVAPDNRSFETLAEAVFAEVIGLNVLELVLKQKEDLEEIQVVGKQIFEVRNGIPVKSPYEFQSIAEVERLQQNLVLYNNDTINTRKRWAEVTLRDGSRVTMTGFGFTAEPTLTIRFYKKKYFDLHALTRPEIGTMNERMAEIVQAVLRSYFNMVVIGATNTGKTNLIKAFIGAMPDHERIVTIESRFELMLKRDFPHKNVIEYEAAEDDGLHNSSQAFKLALRQSPKRICHAEIRDDDANIYVRACTRGHEGSITSVHANSLEDVPDAIADMCMLDGRGMDPGRLVRRIAEYVTQIGFEMDIVGGRRKLVRIGEIVYINGEIRVIDLVRYDYGKRDWVFPGKFTLRSSHRIRRHAPDRFERLLRMGLVVPC
jgi:pilus assembly protein CpaF